jgi:hypothetical protein
MGSRSGRRGAGRQPHVCPQPHALSQGPGVAHEAQVQVRARCTLCLKHARQVLTNHPNLCRQEGQAAASELSKKDLRVGVQQQHAIQLQPLCSMRT